MKRILTFSSDKRWRKQVGGRMFYFGRGKSKSDTKSYRDAEKRYFEFMADRERSKGIERLVSDLTMEDFGEKFLQAQFARYEQGDISPSYFEKLRINIGDLVTFLGPDRPLASLFEANLTDYRNHTLSLPISFATKKTISISTAKSRLDTIKMAIKWGYREALIDRMPRNLGGFSRVKLPPPKVEIFSRKEIKALYMTADDRMRTWILMALNCGFGQADLADLRVGEIDLKERRIHRNRTKTGVETRFVLWPLTMAMLQKTGDLDGEPDARVFRSKNGRPLVHERIVDDKLKKTDSVRSAFSRLTKKLGINGGRGFYTLRKTAASEIEKIDPLATSMFLGHAERGMKKHYAERDWERLGLAIGLLWERLALDGLEMH